MIRPCENTISKSSYSFKASRTSASKFYDNKKSADIVELKTLKPKHSKRNGEIGMAVLSGIVWGVSKIKMDASDILDTVCLLLILG